MNAQSLWERYQKHLCVCDELGLTLDISRMNFDEAGYLSKMAPSMERAYDAMEALEAGAVANVDEQRMVGHYWLRAPGLAPSSEIAAALRETVNSVKEFSAQVHSGTVQPEQSDRFTNLLLIGIGGSALGPQFLADALGNPTSDRIRIHYLDNTDPDGMELTFRRIGDRLDGTLTLVISKSGGTPETRNGMVVAQTEYEKAGLSFAKHAVAITSVGSKLDQIAERDSWLARFPMWDWVGGRTSVTSAVGLLPAALQGLDIDGLLAGAAACDRATRSRETLHNPAALLALMWYHATNGRGEKDMVVLPYKDRLLLFSRYLQQLVMESLGKACDLERNKVEQGIAVYGNKGSTDQHAYVQQLREGVNNFFVTFIEVVEDGGRPIEVEPGITAGDYLRGLLLGTRQALYENGRQSLTISLRRLDAFTVGVLVALFERAVGFYASLINVNAYHQPGVEAGKKAASAILDLQCELMDCLSRSHDLLTAQQVAEALGKQDQIETIFKLLEYLSVNRAEIEKVAGDSLFQSRYGVRRRQPS